MSFDAARWRCQWGCRQGVTADGASSCRGAPQPAWGSGGDGKCQWLPPGTQACPSFCVSIALVLVIQGSAATLPPPCPARFSSVRAASAVLLVSPASVPLPARHVHRGPWISRALGSSSESPASPNSISLDGWLHIFYGFCFIFYKILFQRKCLEMFTS